MVELACDLLLSLPTVLSCEVLSTWLYILDIARIDSAYCHRTKRGSFCTLYDQPELVCSLDRCPRKYIAWALQRRIRLRNFDVCAEVLDDVGLKYLGEYGRFVQSISVDENATSTVVKAATMHCLHVKSVELSRIRVSVSYELLSAFRNLGSLELYDVESDWLTNHAFAFPCLRKLKITSFNVESHHLVSLAAACPCLTYLSLECWHAFSDPSTATILSRLTTLVALNISGSYVDDAKLAFIAQNCQCIVHLDLHSCGEITDAGVYIVATKLRLKSVCLSANSLTNESLKHLGTCASTLRHLHIAQSVGYMYETTKLTRPAIDSLLSQTQHCSFTWRTYVLKHDCSLSICANTTSLTVSTTLTDAVLYDIARHCAHLDYLDIYIESSSPQPQYTSAGFYAVINSCPLLRTISVDQKFDKICYADVLTLHPKLFTCSVVHEYDVMNMT